MRDILAEIEEIISSAFADQDLSNNEKTWATTRTLKALIDSQVVAELEGIYSKRELVIIEPSGSIFIVQANHIKKRIIELRATKQGGLE